MSRCLPPPLVALSPGALAEAGEAGFLRALRAASSAGLRGLLLREPSMPDRPLLALAIACRRTLPEDGWLAIHDRVHLARACEADAVHLGFRSLAPETARELLEDRVALGLSAHAGDDAARWTGADYLVFGPVFDTPSKRGLLEPTGTDGLARAVARSPAPVWAIGGVAPENLEACLDAGGRGVAVLSRILLARDPAAACRAYLARMPA